MQSQQTKYPHFNPAKYDVQVKISRSMDDCLKDIDGAIEKARIANNTELSNNYFMEAIALCLRELVRSKND